MMRSTLLAALILGQAAVLFAGGVAMLWWSDELMGWLIHMVGEERALGPGNVIHLEGGGKLLTNPAGMFRWTLPVWFLGFINISGAVTLVWLWSRGLGRRRGGTGTP